VLPWLDGDCASDLRLFARVVAEIGAVAASFSLPESSTCAKALLIVVRTVFEKKNN
jgi:hypothetical protein